MGKRLFTCALCSADVWLEDVPAGVILCERCRKQGISRRAFFFFAAAAVIAPTLPAPPRRRLELGGLTINGIPVVVSDDCPSRLIILSTPFDVAAYGHFNARVLGVVTIDGEVDAEAAEVRAPRA